MGIGDRVLGSTVGNPDLERLEKMVIMVIQTTVETMTATQAVAKTLAGSVSEETIMADPMGLADKGLVTAAAAKAVLKDPLALVKVKDFKPAALLHVQFNPDKLKLTKTIENAGGEGHELEDSEDRTMSELSFDLYYNSGDAGPESIGGLTDVFNGIEGSQLLKPGSSQDSLLQTAFISSRSSSAIFNKVVRAGKLLGAAVMPDALVAKWNPLVMKVSEWANFWELMADFDPTSHEPWSLQVSWGDFKFFGRMKKADIDFTRFSQTGVATEMTVKLALSGERQNPNNPNAPWFSPDTDKIRDVLLDTTLHSLASEAYNDPGQWRRIARDNDIDNPRRLVLGDKLRLPAI